jgi:hypothetical protein
LKIQERRHFFAPVSRQRLRVSKHVNRVERDNAQDSQRRLWRWGKEERQIAKQAGDRHKAGSKWSRATAGVAMFGPGQT